MKAWRAVGGLGLVEMGGFERVGGERRVRVEWGRAMWVK